MFKLELGLKVKDKVTGYEGIIVGRCEYLFGCNTYGISPQVLKDGKRLETDWIDEGRLEITGEGIKAEEVAAEKPGGEYHDHP